MAIKAGIFGDSTDIAVRYIPSYKKLAKMVKHWKELGLRIVLTSGTWDLFHIGHAEYLKRAREHGDLLIVGVDSDEKVKARKGPHRPVVPENERVEILCHLRHVDVVTLKPLSEKANELIKLIRPDVLIMSESTNHKAADVKEKKKYARKVILMKPQASTSTSAKVRLLHVSGADRFAKEVANRIPGLMEEVMESLAKK
ncbi:MAG: hypothetical protein RLZZ283_76 [Candidatus Parcubacteria bacterium]|jgi:D-beta-D-heptose 7-phosphate kinase/D-beta-D-heptose 1-phosphate adenosyltransferase